MSRGGTNDRSDGSKQICTPVRTKATSYLAVCCGWPQFPLAAIVVGWCVGMVQEGEQVTSVPAVPFSQSLAVLIGGSQRHDGVQVTVQPLLIGTTRACGQFRAVQSDLGG